jgi:Ca2+/Na+ antiporter
MKSLIGSLIAIFAFFVLVLLLLGSHFGGIEIIAWLVALVASVMFTVRRHRKKKTGAEGGM